MAINIVQTIDDGQTITVIGESDYNGKQYTATEAYDPGSSSSRAAAIELATRRVLE